MEGDFRTSWWGQQMAVPLFTSKIQHILFGWYLQHGNFHDCQQSSSIYLAKVITQKTKLHSSQMNPCPDRLLLLLWRAPDLAHPAAAHPVNMDSSIKVIVIANVHDPQDMLGYLPVPLVNVAPVDLVLTLWQTKETSCEEHSTLWDDGIGPKRSQCLYLIRH